MDTSVKQTPIVGPCLSLLLLFSSLQDRHHSQITVSVLERAGKKTVRKALSSIHHVNEGLHSKVSLQY